MASNRVPPAGATSATTSSAGIVQLTDSTSSTSTTTAATPNAVKSAYDLANGAIAKTLTTTTGDIIYASSANTPARLGIGSTDQVLKVSGGVPSWGTIDLTTKTDKATLTTTGDIYYASSASTPARLGIGTTGQVLTVSSGIPSWATPSGSGMVKITSNAFAEQSSVTFNNAFIDAYKCYMIVVTDMFDISGNSQMYLRLRTSGGDYTANYYGALREGSSGSASFTYNGTNGTGYLFGIGNSSATMYIVDPINAGTSKMYGNGFAYGGSDRATILSGHQAAGGSFTGFTITSNNTTNPRLYGKVAVYGLT